MPVVFSERPNGVRINHRGSVTEIERSWWAKGSTDEFEIRDEAYLQLPASEDGIGLRNVEVEPVFDESGYWSVQAIYTDEPVGGSDTTAPSEGDSTFEFDTGGATIHITQSLQTIGGFGPDGATTLPDFNGAIGVTDDEVAGVDVTVPQYQWTEVHYLGDDTVTPDYRAIVYGLTGRWNEAPFRGFDAGEVLLQGVRGSRRESDNLWQISFRFAASQNVTNLQIGSTSDPITIDEKLGWDYLWVYYEQKEDTAASRLVRRPVAAYVERVYQPGDFGQLGIGT